MSWVITFGRWGLTALIAGFGAAILWKLLTSGVRLRGVLLAQDGSVSPGRVQLLLATLFTAWRFLPGIMHHPAHWPDISGGLVMMMGGSQIVYLAAKAWSLYQSRQVKRG